MSAHRTPGPWAVGAGSGNHIAIVARHWDAPLVSRVCAAGRSAQECEANARLIAAAPELLKALKALGPIMADIGYFEGVDPAKVSANADSLGRQIITERQRACNEAWAAIAKAEGR